MGPIILLDKCAAQRLSHDELLQLGIYYVWNVPPILIIEVLADLFKFPDPPGRSIQEVQTLAKKLTGLGSHVCASRAKCALASLMGQSISMTGEIPTDGGQEVVDRDGSKGIFFDEPPEMAALRSWSQGNFKGAETFAASAWRGFTERIDLSATCTLFEKLLPPAPKLGSVPELVSHIEHCLIQPAYQSAYILRYVDDFQMAPAFRSHVMQRWIARGKPLFKDFAPYAYQCFRVQCLFYFGVSHHLISDKKTNVIDLEYLYYSPFCYAFSSADKFLIELAPYCLRQDQMFVVADTLKADLKTLADEWSSMDQAAKIKYREDNSIYPPDRPNSITNTLWTKYAGPRKEYIERAKSYKPDPKEQKEFIEKIMSALPPSKGVPMTDNGLHVRTYVGDGNILLTWDLAESLTNNLAGFAIECKPGNGAAYTITNRLSFQTNYTADTTTIQRIWTPSTQAPIQRFNWLDILKSAEPTEYKYTVTAIYFDPDPAHLKQGAKTTVTVNKNDFTTPHLDIGFTRGYLSSQAYAEKFKNAPFAPTPPTIDFDTTPYQAQYEWLGGHARKLLFDFLNESVADPAISVDVFAYDFDEPDVVRMLAKLGPRLRLFLDNSATHVRPTDLEPKAAAILAQSAGADHVILYHFQRFAHSKVMIQRKNGKAVKVLTGSANFAIRGLYVQANNVLVFNDPAVAGLYGQVFDEAWTNRQNFKSSPLASKWFQFDPWDSRPAVELAFSPHKSADVSLNEVAQAIRDAKSSVLFAIMQLSGGGSVFDEIMKLKDRNVFTYGVAQHASGDLQIFPPGSPNGLLVPFGFLKQHVPEPFVQEWGGGAGQVIHHKFVVVDFNGPNPRLFTGSSNLAKGGEEENGDNLIGFWDPEICTRYAVEAIRLVDHYHFRAAMKNATTVAPLTLSTGDWWKADFDPASLKSHARQILSGRSA